MERSEMRSVLPGFRFAHPGYELTTTTRNVVEEVHMRALIRAAIVALLPLASHLPAAAQQLVPFRVGITDAVNTVLPVWMAQDGDFYGANGLKVEIINMGGGTRGAAELQAGNIDLMRVGMSSVVQ